MTASRPDNEAIFHAARDIPDPDRRREYVREACGGDEARIAHVEALLAAADTPDSLLDRPAGGDPVATTDQPTPESPGTLIGPYKLIQEIGEGGMGTVWMAQQTEPVKRLVALKLIKAGMDSKQVIARFEAERQALALMDHANIARVLDAGTTGAGRPFFVMDLVKGVPITRYCDEHRLTPRQRLELFLPVCQAVQHAHQKGIIHRDLKPSNVLVALYDRNPVPKVIDFGVAKAAGQSLTEKTLVTGFGAIVGTLEYMSPEQAEFNQYDIDSRSDIYALGVLLYELLAGSPPFSRKDLEKAGMLEMLRVIREQEPSKPSTKLSTAEGLPTLAANRGTEPAKLTKLVRGELDWIVMKTLEKDRNRRYETANGFALDVQRYLADEPVQACPPSTWYRLRKFVRRNKRTLATVTALALALLLAVGSIGWAVRDRDARAQEAVLVRQARVMALEVEANSAINEAERLRQQGHWPEALSAANRAEGLLTDGGEELRGRARELRKDLQMVLRLEDIRLRHLVSDQTDAAYAEAFREYGLELESQQPTGAADYIRSRTIQLDLSVALDFWAIRRREIRPRDDTSWQRLLAVSRAADPDVLRNQIREAIEHNDVQALTKMVAALKDNDLPVQTISLVAEFLGPEEGVALLRAAQQKYPNDYHINFQLAWDLDRLPRPQPDEALRFVTAAVALRPRNGPAHLCLGNSLAAKGRLDEAITCYHKVIELSTAASHHRQAVDSLGAILLRQRKFDEAVTWFRRAVELSPQSAWAWFRLGCARYRAGAWKDSIEAMHRSIELDESPKGGESAQWFFLAMAHWRLGEKDKAHEWYERAVQYMDKNQPKDVYRRGLRVEAAEVLAIDKK